MRAMALHAGWGLSVCPKEMSDERTAENLRSHTLPHSIDVSRLFACCLANASESPDVPMLPRRSFFVGRPTRTSSVPVNQTLFSLTLRKPFHLRYDNGLSNRQSRS